TASRNPLVTRNSEATRSLSKRPVRTSSNKPLATSIGDGNTDRGKTPRRLNADQTAMTTRNTINGSSRALQGSGVSIIECDGDISHLPVALLLSQYSFLVS